MSRTVRKLHKRYSPIVFRTIGFQAQKSYESARQDLSEYGIYIPRYDKPNAYDDIEVSAYNEVPENILKRKGRFSSDWKEAGMWAKKKMNYYKGSKSIRTPTHES